MKELVVCIFWVLNLQINFITSLEILKVDSEVEIYQRQGLAISPRILLLRSRELEKFTPNLRYHHDRFLGHARVKKSQIEGDGKTFSVKKQMPTKRFQKYDPNPIQIKGTKVNQIDESKLGDTTKTKKIKTGTIKIFGDFAKQKKSSQGDGKKSDKFSDKSFKEKFFCSHKFAFAICLTAGICISGACYFLMFIFNCIFVDKKLPS